MRASRRSRTAQYAALVRAVLTHKGVLDDEHAIRMLTPMMRVAAGTLKRLPHRVTDTAFYAGLASRTLIFDREVERALDDGIGQVVVIGAGYDSRAWRLARDGVRFVEVDHPATQKDKRRRASRGGPAYVSVDLAEESVNDALDLASIDWAQPVVFVIEGVTMYLDTADVSDLLHGLARKAPRGSRLLVNFAAPTGTGGPQDRRRQFVLAALGRAQGEGFRSARQIQDAGAFVELVGWNVTQATTLRELAPKLLPDGTALDYWNINPRASIVVAQTT